MRALRHLVVAVMVFVSSAGSLAQGMDGARSPAGPGSAAGLLWKPLLLSSTNYSDIWWNPNESGWGLTIADHETHIFAVR